MKKFLLTTLILTLFTGFLACFAESWDDFAGLDKAWDGQKSITNKEFEEAVNFFEQKKKEKEAKQRKKRMKKISGGGTSLHNELNPDSEIHELAPLKKKNEEGHLLNIPVNIQVDEILLDKGFYKIIAEKDKNGDIYLMFYQSQFFKGKVKACETKDDYDEDELDFVRLVPYNDNFVKIIFGSLEFNAYAYVRFVQ